MQLIDQLESGVSLAPVTDQARARAGAAAVLLPITRGKMPRLVLTLRAAHLNSHGGQVAFPGGKWEPGDADLVATALRETREEVDLDPELVELSGALPRRMSRRGVEVSPFVGMIPEQVTLCPNPDEIEQIFMPPLVYFRDTDPVRIDRIDREGRSIEVPAWQYLDYDVWGLTALIIQDLLNALAAH